MKKSQTKYDILTASKVGIEFEMYSEKNSSQISKDLGRVLNKKIIIPISMDALNKEKEGTYHSEVEPTATSFKLEKDFSGGENMRELITGPMAYEEARIVIIKILDWIQNNGWTDKKCAIHLNISFNPYMLKLNNDISHMNTLKFILSFDENFIYSRFPDRANSVYARSIYQVIPINKFSYQSMYDSVDPNNYTVPDEKYYGVNFTKKSKNYLEFRYLGGSGYEYKIHKILEILDYCVLKIYNALQNTNFTGEEIQKLKKMMVDQKIVTDTFSSMERFLIEFPDVSVFVNMNGNREIIKTFWTTIRDFLFNAVVSGNMINGIYNYDTDASISQLRYSKLRNAHQLKDFEFFDCDLEGSFTDSSFFRCKIKDSRLNRCKLIELNEVYDSKVENTSSLPSNAMFDCYINSPDQIIEGKIQGGVIRNAVLGKNVEISKRTLIVNKKGVEKHFVSDDKKFIGPDNDKK